VEYAFVAGFTHFDLGGWGADPGGQDQPFSPPEGEESTDSKGSFLFRREQNDEQIPGTDSPQPALDRLYGYRVTPEFFKANRLVPARGSLFTMDDIENGKPFLVLGSKVAENLFEDGKSLDREVYARRQLYRITGILQPTGTDYDNMAFAPAIVPGDPAGTQMSRMYFMRYPSSLHFVISDVEQLEEARGQLNILFEQKYGENTVMINLPGEEAQSAIKRNERISIIILFLALSGLIIVDVNVSNILFGRMIRSRKKIGILKAIGASRRDIFGIFSIEGFFLSIGGVVAGAGIFFFFFRIIGESLSGAVINPIYLAVGVLSAWLVTMSLTTLPALQALGIPTADAIRYAMYSRDFVFLPKFLNAKKQNLPKPIAHRNLPFSCDRRLRYDAIYENTNGSEKVSIHDEAPDDKTV